jgi:hypothetical protein
MLMENQNFSEQIQQYYQRRATYWRWQQLFSLEAGRDFVLHSFTALENEDINAVADDLTYAYFYQYYHS